LKSAGKLSSLRARLSFIFVLGCWAIWLNLFAQEPPANNNYAEALELTGPSATAAVRIDFATREPDEPVFQSNFSTSGQSLWWKWMAPESGTVVLTFAGPTFWPVVGVLEGASLTNTSAVLHRFGSTSPPNFSCWPVFYAGFPPESRWVFSARAGTTYRIGVDAGSLERVAGSAVLNLNFSPEPGNDLFGRAAVLDPNATALTGIIGGASRETGEALVDGGSGKTVWFSWSAPRTGMYTFRSTDTNQAIVLSFWNGSTLPTLVLNRNGASHWSGCQNFWWPRPVVTISAREADVFWIQADTVNPVYTGAFAFDIRFEASPPPNDDLRDRVTLSGTALSVTNSNRGATREKNEPAHFVDAGGSSVWYSWRAPGAGSLTISTNEPVVFQPPTVTNLPSLYDGGSSGTIGSGVIVVTPHPGTLYEDDPDVFEPIFSIYRSDPWLQLLNAGPDLVIRTEADQDYLIAVDSKRGLPGEFKMSLAFNALPPNDDFENSIAIGGGHVRVTGYLTGASAEVSEPAHNGRDATHSVWWSWKAPGTGPVSIVGSQFAGTTGVAVYRGNSLTSLLPVVKTESPLGVWTFAAVRDELYRVAVDSADGRVGSVEVELEMQVPGVHVFRPLEQFASNFWFIFKDRAGRSVRIDHSTNLIQWTSLSTNLLEADVTRFTVPRTAEETIGFLRVISFQP
jgi:hypothetical protein